MPKRSRIPMRKSKRDFARKADMTHQKNMAPRRSPMRGGIRL